MISQYQNTKVGREKNVRVHLHYYQYIYIYTHIYLVGIYLNTQIVFHISLSS